MYSTLLTKQLMMRIARKDKIRQRILPRKEFEILRLGTNVPETKLPTGGAIAFAGLGKVGRNLEFDCAAQTASVVLFEGGHIDCVDGSWFLLAEVVSRQVEVIRHEEMLDGELGAVFILRSSEAE